VQNECAVWHLDVGIGVSLKIKEKKFLKLRSRLIAGTSNTGFENQQGSLNLF